MSNSSRLAHIDALRGLAALLVVWQHAGEIFVKFPSVQEKGTLLADVAHFADFGRIGVICFFLISGFIIPCSLKFGVSGSLKKFAIRRFFRLYPAYWLSIGAAVLTSAVVWGVHPPYSTLLANLTMLQTFLGEPHIQGLYWTLQIELVFYVVCVLAFSAGILHTRNGLIGLIVAAFGLFIAVHALGRVVPSIKQIEKEILYMPYLLSIMFLGALMRHVHDSGKPMLRSGFVLAGVALCFGFPIGVMALGSVGVNLVPEPNRFGISHTMGFVVFSAGLAWLMRAPRALLWLGTISYSIYLLHPIVLSIIRKFAVEYSEYLPHLSVFIILTMLISIVLATLVYYLVEKPAIDAGHKYST